MLNLEWRVLFLFFYYSTGWNLNRFRNSNFIRFRIWNGATFYRVTSFLLISNILFQVQWCSISWSIRDLTSCYWNSWPCRLYLRWLTLYHKASVTFNSLKLLFGHWTVLIILCQFLFPINLRNIVVIRNTFFVFNELHTFLTLNIWFIRKVIIVNAFILIGCVCGANDVCSRTLQF